MGRKFRGKHRPRTVPKAMKMSASDRAQWAREQWERYPDISVNGKNGMYERMSEIFGVAIKVEQLYDIKEDVLRKQQQQQKKNGKGSFNPVLSPELRESIEHASSADAAADAPPPPPPPGDPLKGIGIDLTRRTPESEPVEEEPLVTKPKRPGTTARRDDVAIRRRYALEIIKSDPDLSMHAVNAQIYEEFGIGTNMGWIANEIEKARRKQRPAPAAPVPAPTPAPSAAPKEQAPEAIRSAIEMLMEEVPGLRWLEIKIENGRPQVDYEIAAVRRGKVEF